MKKNIIFIVVMLCLILLLTFLRGEQELNLSGEPAPTATMICIGEDDYILLIKPPEKR